MDDSVSWLIIIAVAVIFILGYKPKSIRRAFVHIHHLTERKRSYQLRLVNQYRKKSHLPPLRNYYELDSIARGHSRTMSFRRVCNHEGFPLRASKVRQITGSGYVGENCFMYPSGRYDGRTARKLVQGWMNSPGHRANILNPKYSKIGIGIVTKGRYTYATQIFCS